jgi:hypothetical protein
MILREKQHVASPRMHCMEIKVWHTVARIDGKDRVYRMMKRQERVRMYKGYQSFVSSWGDFLHSFGE